MLGDPLRIGQVALSSSMTTSAPGTFRPSGDAPELLGVGPSAAFTGSPLPPIVETLSKG